MKPRISFGFIVGIVLAIGIASPAWANGTITWTGNGSDNLPCPNGGHWVLAPSAGITGRDLDGRRRRLRHGSERQRIVGGRLARRDHGADGGVRHLHGAWRPGRSRAAVALPGREPLGLAEPFLLAEPVGLADAIGLAHPVGLAEPERQWFADADLDLDPTEREHAAGLGFCEQWHDGPGPIGEHHAHGLHRVRTQAHSASERSYSPGLGWGCSGSLGGVLRDRTGPNARAPIIDEGGAMTRPLSQNRVADVYLPTRACTPFRSRDAARPGIVGSTARQGFSNGRAWSPCSRRSSCRPRVRRHEHAASSFRARERRGVAAVGEAVAVGVRLAAQAVSARSEAEPYPVALPIQPNNRLLAGSWGRDQSVNGNRVFRRTDLHDDGRLRVVVDDRAHALPGRRSPRRTGCCRVRNRLVGSLEQSDRRSQ